MSISIPGRVVVFDYGEVISRTPSEADREALLAVADLPDASAVAAFWAAYWGNRHDLDRGTLSTGDYWRTIAAATGANWGAATLQHLWAADYRSWFLPEPGTVDLLAELHAGGTRLAILSNAGFDFGDPLRHSPIGEFAEVVVVSAEHDVIKPAARIFEITAEALGIAPRDMVFIDNRADNVAGAEALGITGHVFTDPGSLRSFLETIAEPETPAA